MLSKNLLLNSDGIIKGTSLCFSSTASILSLLRVLAEGCQDQNDISQLVKQYLSECIHNEELTVTERSDIERILFQNNIINVLK